MKETQEFYNLHDAAQGLRRELSPGLSARIFVGDNAMLSVVDLEPNAEGLIHSHPEEQWGLLLEGSGVRIQGDSARPVKKGDFWRTPGGVRHGFRAGPQGARILDIFSPPRPAYKKEGKGLAALNDVSA